MKKLVMITALLVLTSLTAPGDVFAMMHGEGRQMRPYGGYCQGPRWGWYGAHRAVTTVEETRSLLEEFLKETDLLVGEIRDRDTYYEADILNVEKEKVDMVIVDKRTSRVRSVY